MSIFKTIQKSYATTARVNRVHTLIEEERRERDIKRLRYVKNPKIKVRLAKSMLKRKRARRRGVKLASVFGDTLLRAPVNLRLGSAIVRDS